MGSVALEGFGSGGAALNFKVVPGLTQPGTASENTIWVKTERIGSWYFSATQPEGMQEWDVWFSTGTESRREFNALKRNCIEVYPLSAKQYVGGILVSVIAKTYQKGKWDDWVRYLYDAGNAHEDITGGWTNEGYTYGGASIGGPTNVNGQLVFDSKSGKYYGGGGTRNKIDISGFSTLRVVGEIDKEMSWVLIGVYSAKELNNPVASTRLDDAIGADYDLSVHLSDVPPGSYYIGGVFNGSATKAVLE